MKKTLLTNPAFRYIFEIIVIVFSVSLSFYIQDILNEREKIELKNAALSGVLEDLESDKNSFSYGIRVNDIRISNIQKFLKKDISNDVISYLRRYYGFTGNDSNYKALVSTGSLEVIDNKSLFKNINNYYMTNYKMLNDGADRDQELFMKFIDYTEKKYKIDSVSNFIENSFFKVNFDKKGEKYAPSFGMMGTVMGLIVMMNGFELEGKELSETMTDLLGGMGTALITTLYGVLFANFIFGPIAGKLETLSGIEVRHRTVVMEGIMSIHSREHPIIVKERLMTFVPIADKENENKVDEK